MPIKSIFQKYNIDQIIKHIIDHTDNLYADAEGHMDIMFTINYNMDQYEKKLSFIEYVYMYASPTIAKYFSEKIDIKLPIEARTGYPIHIICRYQTPNLIKYIIENYDVNLNCMTRGGYTPFNYLCRNKLTTVDMGNINQIGGSFKFCPFNF